VSSRKQIIELPSDPVQAITALAKMLAEQRQQIEALEARHGLPGDLRVSINEAGEVVVTRVTSSNTATITPPL
jgi:hypothetical protein